MKQFLVVPIVSLLAAGAASAEFTGLDIREDVDMTNAPAGARTFSVYATFDGQSFIDHLLAVGQTGPGYRTNGFGINTFLNPDADFYQELAPILGQPNTHAPPNALIALSPTFAYDTFVDLGLKTVASGEIDNTYQDPDFGFYDTNGSGGEDFITGGWAAAPPTGPQGFADANGDVFIAQLTIMGLSDNTPIGQYDHSTGVFTSSIFTGRLSIFRQGDHREGNEPPAVQFDITFQNPSPGTLALFGFGGIAATRRRR